MSEDQSVFTMVGALKYAAMDLAKAEQQCRELRDRVDSIEREIYERLRAERPCCDIVGCDGNCEEWAYDEAARDGGEG